jgi:hypothetical protein
MSAASSECSHRLAAVSALMLGLVVAAAVIVGAYALHNPNHVRFAAPWPLVSGLVAAAVAATLALGVHAQRRRARPGLFAVEAGAAVLALVMLGAVAFALSFNQL